MVSQLFALVPRIAGYLVSFLVIGIYWEAHHRMFGFITACTRTLIWLNLLELMLIAFLPFPTALIGRYAFVPAAVMFYASAVLAVGLVRTAIWWYATHVRRLIDADTPESEIRAGLWRGITAPLVFAISIPIASIAPVTAMLSWIAIVPLLRLIDWRVRKA